MGLLHLRRDLEPPRHQLRALVDVEQAVRVGAGAVGVAGDVVQRVGPDLESDQVPLARHGADGLEDGAEVAVVGDADDVGAAVVVEHCGDDGVVGLPAGDGVVRDRPVEAGVLDSADCTVARRHQAWAGCRYLLSAKRLSYK